MTIPNMIEAEGLRVVCEDGYVALSDVSFSLESGSRTALIGANGAGKSTLLLSMVGVVPYTSGVLRVANAVVDKKTFSELWKTVGLVFQNPDDQLFTMKVVDDLAFGLRNQGLDELEVERRVTETLERMDIIHLRNRMPSRLSLGEKRSVAIGAVLAMEPKVLLLDEPTSFLDPRSRSLLVRTLASLPQTQLIATHDLDFARGLCERVIILQKGKVQAEGKATDLLSDHSLLIRCGLELAPQF
ncbi:MAG: ABC transporter ATP-binding protein [Thermoguttaceae bacterium]|nr:ABC transporter ATP-binding protein [Thermoguttaceae bacterium]